MRRIDLKKANVARSNTIRDINRQIVLNYVRERGPISRAEIAHETALQRSTVSLIVEELRVDGLIEEVSGESTGGRPPILLSLRTAVAVAIGVDVGTNRTIVATSDLAGRVLEEESFDTHPDAEETIKRVIESARKLIRRNPDTIEGIGVSLPGLVNPDGTELFVPTFAWRDLPLAKALTEGTGLPVTMDNDANAAALAELWFGRPEIREVRDFILVLVEDGVGTGIVFDGQVYRGENGAAGEFGHMTIGQGAPVACASGSRECWEAFASERSALARYKKLDERDERSRGARLRRLDRSRITRGRTGASGVKRDRKISRRGHRELDSRSRAGGRDRWRTYRPCVAGNRRRHQDDHRGDDLSGLAFDPHHRFHTRTRAHVDGRIKSRFGQQIRIRVCHLKSLTPRLVRGKLFKHKCFVRSPQ